MSDLSSNSRLIALRALFDERLSPSRPLNCDWRTAHTEELLGIADRLQRENTTLAGELTKWTTEAQREKDRRNAHDPAASKELAYRDALARIRQICRSDAKDFQVATIERRQLYDIANMALDAHNDLFVTAHEPSALQSEWPLLTRIKADIIAHTHVYPEDGWMVEDEQHSATLDLLYEAMQALKRTSQPPPATRHADTDAIHKAITSALKERVEGYDDVLADDLHDAVMQIINPRASVTKEELCSECRKPLPPLARWSMPACPECVEKADRASAEKSARHEVADEALSWIIAIERAAVETGEKPACDCEGPRKIGPGYHAPYCATMAGTEFAKKHAPVVETSKPLSIKEEVAECYLVGCPIIGPHEHSSGGPCETSASQDRCRCGMLKSEHPDGTSRECYSLSEKSSL